MGSLARYLVVVCVGLALGVAGGMAAAPVTRVHDAAAQRANAKQARQIAAKRAQQSKQLCAAFKRIAGRKMQRTATDQWGYQQIKPAQAADAIGAVRAALARVDGRGSKALKSVLGGLSLLEKDLRDKPIALLGAVGTDVDVQPEYVSDIGQGWDQLLEQRVIPGEELCESSVAVSELVTYPLAYDEYSNERIPRSGELRELTAAAGEV